MIFRITFGAYSNTAFIKKKLNAAHSAFVLFKPKDVFK